MHAILDLLVHMRSLLKICMYTFIHYEACSDILSLIGTKVQILDFSVGYIFIISKLKAAIWLANSSMNSKEYQRARALYAKTSKAS